MDICGNPQRFCLYSNVEPINLSKPLGRSATVSVYIRGQDWYSPFENQSSQPPPNLTIQDLCGLKWELRFQHFINGPTHSLHLLTEGISIHAAVHALQKVGDKRKLRLEECMVIGGAAPAPSIDGDYGGVVDIFVEILQLFDHKAAITVFPAVHAAPAHSILHELQRKYQESVGCDFSLVVGDVVLPVHKFILDLRSDYFRTMLLSGYSEVTNGECGMSRVLLPLGETPFIDVVKIFVQYLYTDELRFPIDASDAEITAIVDELLWAAEFYMVPSLGVECQRVLELVARKADFVRLRELKAADLQDMLTNRCSSPVDNLDF